MQAKRQNRGRVQQAFGQSRSRRVGRPAALLEGLESRVLLSGIQLVADIYPGVQFSAIDQTTAMGGKVYFSDWYKNLYASGAGTTSLIKVLPDGFFIEDMVATSDHLFLRGMDNSINYELWTSDGTTAGTTPISATGLDSDDGSHFVFGNRLFFAGKGDDGTDKPWVSDGTAAGTYQLADVALAQTTPVVLEGQLYFMGGSGLTYSLYKSDGTPGGTSKVWDMPTGNAPSVLGQAGGEVLVPEFGHFYGVSAAGAATELAPLYFSDEFVTWKGVAYFGAQGPEGDGLELWRSDGTVAGTYIVKDINPGAAWSNPGYFAPTDNQLLFIASTADTGYEWWSTDGTAVGTHITRDTIPGPSGINISMVSLDHYAVADNVVYFPSDGPDANGQAVGPELWQTDGTTDGTRLVQDLNPGPDGSWPMRLCTVGQTVYFQAASATVTDELFSYTKNIPPTASITGPMSVGENNSLKLGATGNDPDGSIARWEWDFDYDGKTFDVDATGQTPTFSAVGIDSPATRTIAVRSVDDIGAYSDVATGTLSIVNMAPTATFAVVGRVYAGRAATVGFSNAHDSSTADTAAGFLYSYDFNNDGVFEVVNSTSASVTIPGSYLPAARNYTIGGRIADQWGAFTDYKVSVSALAVPVANAGGPYNVNAGSGVHLQGSGVAGAGLSIVVYQWDLNYDGTTFDVDSQSPTPQFSAASINGPATRTVALRVEDSQGMFSDIATATVYIANAAPTAIFLSKSTVGEQQPAGTVVGGLSATDPGPGSVFTYSLVSGTGSTDNAAFTVDPDGTLRTAAALDFETGKTTYSVRVRATDEGGLSCEQAFTIAVTDVNEAPTGISLSSPTVAENQPAGTVVGTFTATDPDAVHSFTYSLVAGADSEDNAAFTIDAAGRLQTARPLDFETQSSYAIRVRVTDQGGLYFEKTLTITATNVNEAPTDVSLSPAAVQEQKPVGTVVGSLVATDPDSGNTFTWSLVSGAGSANNASFTIVGNTLKTHASFNFATKSSYTIRVRATDQDGLWFEKSLTVGVTQRNLAPTGLRLQHPKVAENQPGGTVVGTLLATDPNMGETFTYRLVAGVGSDDNALFSIDGATLKTNTNASFDYETRKIYSIRVRAIDHGNLKFTKVLTVNVTDVNEAPTTLGLSSKTIAENQPVGTAIGQFSASDPDAGNTFIYTLVDGSGSGDNAAFKITADGKLKALQSFDFETKSAYSIRVRATDQGGLFCEKAIKVNVTNVNEAPTGIALSNASVMASMPLSTLVGNLIGTDLNAGSTLTYTMVPGTGSRDNANFTIVGNKLRTAATLSYSYTAANTRKIRVRVTDQFGQWFEQALVINVIPNPNVN